MRYDYKKYIQLRNYDQELKKQNKSLIREDKIKYSRLIGYSAQVSNKIHWLEKKNYLELITKFLNFEMTGEQFDKKFSQMIEKNEKRAKLLSYDELKDIEPTLISYEFGTLVSEIYLCCNEFSKDSNRLDPVLKTEEQLRKAINSLLPEIQKYF